MAGRFVDFYALLNIASDASSDVVREAITEQRKAWEPRQTDSDPANRSAAEDRIRDIDLAELILLDPGQRADYDEEWHGRRNGHAGSGPGAQEPRNGNAAHPVGTATTPPEQAPPAAGAAAVAVARGESEDDWVGAAREAAGAGDFTRAIDSFHYAIMLYPRNITLHFELGLTYVQAGNYQQALGAFETASRLAPQVLDYRAAVGNTLVHLGRPGDAIGVLEQVVGEMPTEPRYRAELARALHDTCVHEMTLLTDGLVCITTADQAQLVERLTGRALTLLDASDHSQLAQDIREKHRLAQLARKRAWRPPLPWWLMLSFTAVIALGFSLWVAWWSGPIAIAVLAGVAFLLGLQPTWWHVAREARDAELIAETDTT